MMLAGKTAIVTGGSAGIGAAIVRRFTREGCRVAILDIDTDGARGVAAAVPGEVMFVRCNVSSADEVKAAVTAVLDRHGSIDILVNSAGLPPQIASVEELSESDWDSMMDVHAKGCFLCCRHVMPHMESQRRGTIVNIASLGGVRGRPDRHTYIAAKHAIVGLTKSLALEGIAHNVRVNAIAPGPVAETGGQSDLAAHRALGGSEISFATTPDSVAWAAVFLAADESTNITGVVLPVDGGILAGSLARGPLRFPTR